MDPKRFKEFIRKIGEITILTKQVRYFLEASLLFIVLLIIASYILPQVNVFYLLLIYPAILAGIVIAYLMIRIVNRPELGIPIIAFFLPFERIGALSYSSINIRLSQVFTLVMLISYILYITFHSKNKLGDLRIKKDYSFLFLIIFGLINIASLAVAPNRVRSIEVLAFDLFIFFIYILISNILVSKDILEKTIWAILIISLILSLYGIFQFVADMLNLPLSISGLREAYSKVVFGFPRVQSTESEPQYWGNFLIIPISISLAILLNSFKKLQSSNIIQKVISKKLIFISIIVLILAIINMLMTFSRGAWIGAAAAIGVVALIFIRKFLNLKFIIATVVVIGLATVGAIFILNYTHSPLTLDVLTQRATALDDSDRTITTNDAIALFDSHKLIGIGIGSFGPYEASNYFERPFLYNGDLGWRIVNNEYLEVLTETGIIGFISFAAFLIYLILNIIFALNKKIDIYTKTMFIGLIGAFIGLLVQYWAFSTLYIMQVWVLFALVNAVAFNINFNYWKD